MTDDDLACAVALLDLPGMTPVRLARVLDGLGPTLAWHAVRAGTHPGDRSRRFAGPARQVVPTDVLARYRAAGVSVLLPGGTGYPTALVGDPGAPAVLTALGDATVAEGRPAVAVVGTRSATPYGASVAAELGRGLAASGVVVVSGLALGIDAAAHAGALDAGPGAAAPVAVVGTGLDVVYPKVNRVLWERVVAAGAVLSESPLATPALPRVFPARNRIIAALADVVVVVECHGRGGSFHTVEAAARRAVPVCAVPGSVRSPASRGTNGMLVDGCTPVRDLEDVLTALALARGGRALEPGRAPRGTRAPDVDRRLEGLARSARAVWDAVDDTPTTIETVLLRTDLAVATVAVAVADLVRRGLLTEGAGWWSRS
jgi:DNA processing protein